MCELRPARPSALLISHEDLTTEATNIGLCYALISPIGTPEFEVPPKILDLLDTYADVCSPLDELLPVGGIQHATDFVLGASLPNLLHYCMPPTEHEGLQR